MLSTTNSPFSLSHDHSEPGLNIVHNEHDKTGPPLILGKKVLIRGPFCGGHCSLLPSSCCCQSHSCLSNSGLPVCLLLCLPMRHVFCSAGYTRDDGETEFANSLTSESLFDYNTLVWSDFENVLPSDYNFLQQTIFIETGENTFVIIPSGCVELSTQTMSLPHLDSHCPDYIRSKNQNTPKRGGG